LKIILLLPGFDITAKTINKGKLLKKNCQKKFFETKTICNIGHDFKRQLFFEIKTHQT